MEAVEGINSIKVSQLVRGRYHNGRIAVPVKSSVSLYARYKHVVGVRSSNGSGGVSLTKLRMLDTLIDQLKKLKGEKAFVKDVSGISGENVDKLVEQYQKELNRVIKSKEAIASFQSTGMLVDQFA